MKITKAIVILSSVADKIILETDMPCPYVMAFMPNQQNLSLSFEATYDLGVQYVRDHFNLEPEIIDTRYQWSKK